MGKIYLPVLICLLIGCTTKEKNNNQTKAETSEKSAPATAQKEKQASAPNKKASTEGMVHFDGGKILIGSETGTPDEQPVFEKEIAPFYMDKNLVTVAEFRKFVEATGFKTDADKFGDSGVFDFQSGNWALTKGANWEFPFGPAQPKAEDNHPVTHVSWNDAYAYANWAGKRLPTEFEWEYAAKNGKSDASRYAWGDQLIIKGRYMANVWQGASVTQPEALDGFLYTSPVGTFGSHESGLSDMGGNVWQWCANTYEGYPGSPTAGQKDESIKCTRGGSFMYDQAGEASFTTTFRSKNTTDTSLFNTGFRCAL